ncbi:MAG: transporter substrate-binding domain-containing protein, partial [Eubacteriales bacterium]|nr:transporter substrate-binding domain-containing protein [Eubacteriales bacterium]
MKKILSLILAVGLTFSLVACGGTTESAEQPTETAEQENQNTGSEENSNSKVDEIKEKGYISVATSPDYAPYEFKIIENGQEKIVGFDIAIVEEVAKDLGVDLKIVEMDFDGILLELESGNVDLGMSGFSVTEERKKAVDFSDVYYTASQSILVKASDLETYTSAESFANKNIGVQLTSIQESMAREQLTGANIVSLSTIPNIIMDLNIGNIDAAVVETPVAEGYVEQFPDLAISEVKLVEETNGAAIAIKKGNGDLVEAVNSTITRLKSENLIDKFVAEANELVG